MSNISYLDTCLENTRKAIYSGQYRVAIFYAKKLPVDSSIIAHLLLDCATLFWKSVRYEDVSEKDISVVIESFTRVLGYSQADYVRRLDYIQLSNIYVSCGLIDNALSIVELSLDRSFFEDLALNFQRWALLIHMGMTESANAVMTKICEDVTIVTLYDKTSVESKDAYSISGSDLKVSYAYLFCANFLNQRFKNTKSNRVRKEVFMKMKALVMESHFLLTERDAQNFQEAYSWFNSHVVWFDMGRNLQNTSFDTVLAEAAFWESYHRNPRSNKGLRSLVQSMMRSKRLPNVFMVLERAMVVYNWNAYCRRTILSFNSSNWRAAVMIWSLKFEREESLLVRIQAFVRGAVSRRQFYRNREAFVENRKNLVAEEKKFRRASQVMNALSRKRIMEKWKIFVLQVRMVKYKAASKIQSEWKRVFTMRWYAWLRYKVAQANRKFYQVSELSYHSRRLRIFKDWRHLAHFKRHRHAAIVLINTLQTTLNSLAVNDYLHFHYAILEILKQSMGKRYLQNWKRNYFRRRRKHAMMTIRFFIRRSSRRFENDFSVKNALAQQRVASAETAVVNIRKKSLVRTRKHFSMWRAVYQCRKETAARLLVARKLPGLSRCWRSRHVIMARRRLFELSLYFADCRKFRLSKGLFFCMKCNRATQTIQRFVRRVKALRIYRIVVFQKRIADLKFNCHARREKLNAIQRWKKFIHLIRMKRLQARCRIIKAIKLAGAKNILSRLLKKKMQHWNGMMILHRCSLQRFWNYYRLGESLIRRSNRMGRCIDILNGTYMRISFRRWAYNSRHQKLLLALLHRGRVFAADSVSSGQILPLTEKVKGLHTMGTVVVRKSFKIWLDMYHERRRVRRPFAQSEAERIALESSSQFVSRTSASVLLQKNVRSYIARRSYRVTISRRRVAQERKWRHDSMEKRVCCIRLLDNNRIQSIASRRIQGVVRQLLSRKEVERRRVYAKNVTAKADRIKLVCTANIFRKYLAAMIFRFCLSASKRYPHFRFMKDGSHDIGETGGEEELTHRVPMNGVVKLNEAIVSGARDVQDFSVTASHSKYEESMPAYLSSKTVPLPLVPVTRLKSQAHCGSNISSRAAISTIPAGGGESNRLLGSRRRPWLMEFQSLKYHADMHRLRRTGIFILDSGSVEAAAYEKHGVKEDFLSANEVKFFLRNCKTLFCEDINSNTLHLVLELFKGSKLVMAGGKLTERDFSKLIRFFSDREYSTLQEPQPKSHPASLHIGRLSSDCRRGCLMFSLSLFTPNKVIPTCSLSAISQGRVTENTRDKIAKPPKEKSFPLPIRIRELSVDSRGLGPLALCVTLSSLRSNSEIEVFIALSARPNSWPAAISNILQFAAAANVTLKDLRLQGSPLPLDVLEALHLSIVRHGFSVLENLEFVVDSANERACELAEAIVQAGAVRAETAKRMLAANELSSATSGKDTSIHLKWRKPVSKISVVFSKASR